ncbi:MAG: Segregation and condensation protein A [Parcubacteria group bacterium GW2011_GWB1_53_43]|nr:MAG: Segregation and condensation protein A [Parcubacteria group bacterium GW2011_GWB1_53_43]
MNAHYAVELEHFSGPLDLLLELVEKRKLHINDVSLAQITEGFLKYLKPGLSLTEEETESVAELERRLQMLSHIREGAELIRKYFGAMPLFLPHAAPPRQTVFMPPRDMSLSSLSVALVAVIASFPKEEKLTTVMVKKVISLEEAIGSLLTRVTRSLSLSFKDFVGEKKEKVDIIVSFLGMLELVKQGSIDVRQDAHFSDIHMESSEVGVPRYS